MRQMAKHNRSFITAMLNYPFDHSYFNSFVVRVPVHRGDFGPCNAENEGDAGTVGSFGINMPSGPWPCGTATSKAFVPANAASFVLAQKRNVERK